MLDREALDSLYATGYHKIPPLLVNGEPAFSSVAHTKGLYELAWNAEVHGILDAASTAISEGNAAIGQWLNDRANLMIMERDELARDSIL